MNYQPLPEPSAPEFSPQNSQPAPVQHQQNQFAPTNYQAYKQQNISQPTNQQQNHPHTQPQPQPTYAVHPNFTQPHQRPGPVPVAVPVYQTAPLHFTQLPPAFVPSHYPCRCICPYCNSDVVTRISRQTGLMNWLGCLGVSMFGCILGCCLIPFAIEDWKDSIHYCPNCNCLIAKAARIK